MSDTEISKSIYKWHNNRDESSIKLIVANVFCYWTLLRDEAGTRINSFNSMEEAEF